MLCKYSHSKDIFRIQSDIEDAPFLNEHSTWLKDIINFCKKLHLKCLAGL